MASLARATRGSKRQMWPTMNRPRPARAAATILSHSVTLAAMGFSRSTFLPACQGVDRDLAVVVVMRDHAQGVDFRVGQQFAVIGVAAAARGNDRPPR